MDHKVCASFQEIHMHLWVMCVVAYTWPHSENVWDNAVNLISVPLAFFFFFPGPEEICLSTSLSPPGLAISGNHPSRE